MLASSTPSFSIAAALVAAALATAQVSEKAAPSRVPADGEHAAEALKASPRHGEWVDVALAPPADASGKGTAAGGAKLHTWVVYPERKEKAPVVIVIHEIFGMSDWVRAVADQLAAEGFIAIAPDLLSGKGPGGGGTESFSGDGVRDAIRQLSKEEVAWRLDAARTHGLALPSASGKSGCIGFCWGGGMSFQYATVQPKLDAAVVYYGSAPVEKEALAKIHSPVLGLYGGDDARVTATVEPTAKLMEELKKPYTHHAYEGAGHGFLRQQSGRDGANAKAASQAWRETLAFLAQHLE